MLKLRKESVKFLCGRAEAQTRNQQKNLRSEFKIALRRCCKRRIGANPQIHIRWADREDSKLNPLSKHWLGAEYLFKLEMWDNKVAQFCISFSFISNTETNNILWHTSPIRSMLGTILTKNFIYIENNHCKKTALLCEWFSGQSPSACMSDTHTALCALSMRCRGGAEAWVRVCRPVFATPLLSPELCGLQRECGSIKGPVWGAQHCREHLRQGAS